MNRKPSQKGYSPDVTFAFIVFLICIILAIYMEPAIGYDFVLVGVKP